MLNVEKFQKNIFSNAVGELGSRFPLVLVEVFAAKYLGPAVYGVWSTIQLAVNYNNFTHFGFLSGMAREEPYLLGKKDNEQANRVKSVTFTILLTIILSLSSFFLLGYFSASAWFFPEWLQHSLLVLLIVSLLIIQQLYIFWQTTLQNNLQFLTLSIGKLIYAFVFLLAIVLTIKEWGLIGGLGAWLFAYIVSIIYYFYTQPQMRPTLVYKHDIAVKLFKIGFPIYIFGVVKLLITTIDKLMITTFLGVEQLGFYNVSAALLVVITLLGGMVARVLSPHLMKLSAELNDPGQLYSHFLSVFAITMVNVSLVSGAVVLCISPFVHYVLPLYEEGINPGFFLVFAGNMAAAVQFISSYLIAVNDQKLMTKITVAMLVAISGLTFLAVLIYDDIAYIAAAAFLGWCIYTLILFFQASRAAGITLRIFFNGVFKVFGPFLGVLLFSGVLFLCQQRNWLHFDLQMVQELLPVFVYAIFLIGVFFYFDMYKHIRLIWRP